MTTTLDAQVTRAFDGAPDAMLTNPSATNAPQAPGDPELGAPEALAYLHALHETTLDLMNRRDVHDLLTTILARASALASTAHGYIYVSDDLGGLRAEILTGAFEVRTGDRLTRGVGLAGKAWETGRSQAVEDYDAWEGRDPSYPLGVLRSGFVVPLTSSDGEVIGVIGLARSEVGRTFDDDDVLRLTGFARLASIALENARLHESARREVEERSVTEKALRETEESYRRLVELSPDGIVVHVENLFVYANERAAAMLGVADPSDLLGLPVMDFVHPDHRTSVLERRRLMFDRRTSVPVVERQFLRADGSAFDVEVAASPLTYKGQDAIQAVFRDISARLATERALRSAEAEFRTLIERLPVVTYRYPLDSVVALYVSPQIEDLTGYAQAQWTTDVGLWERVLDPQDRDLAIAENQRTDRSLEPFVLEYRMIAADGRTVWVHDESRVVFDDEGRPRFWQGVMVDITERKAAQRGLHRAEAKYRSLIERLPGVTYTFAHSDVRFDVGENYVSPQIATLLGCTPQEWLATETAWHEFLHPDDRARVVARWEEALSSEEPFDIEYRMVARSGAIAWVQDHAALVRDERGAGSFWQGFINDVTDRRAAEETLKAAFEREREVSRRFRTLDEMKNTFLAAVSHELRTPLSAILGFALTLEREELHLEPEESREMLHRLAANARKLNRLLSDLLDLDRLGRGIVEPRRRSTDMPALIRQVVENADGLESHRPSLDLDPVSADIDAPKVERIVENLLANAVRHTPIGSGIWIRVRAVAEGGVLIIVDDEGPGIPDELRGAVFEPFQQVPGRQVHAPGVGIGLSLVARFAELHGGRAWVEPRAGGGSSFHVLLPDRDPVNDGVGVDPDRAIA